MISEQAPSWEAGVVPVTVGVCAYNEERRISGALESILAQRPEEPFSVTEVIVVASGCTDGTEQIVEAWSRRDPRVILVKEPTRAGKSHALNAIFGKAHGEIIVSVNADATLMPNALGRLLALFAASSRVQLACGAPIPPAENDGLVGIATQLQWRLHNRTLATLSSLGMPNHCCDEFMAMRRGFVETLPAELVNDGAYLAAFAVSRNTFAVFCETAQVVVDPPRDLRGYLIQRRRILRGHRQVEALARRPPITLERLIRRHPELATRILVREVLTGPASVLAFAFLLLPLEATALIAASFDQLLRRPYEPIWRMVD